MCGYAPSVPHENPCSIILLVSRCVCVCVCEGVAREQCVYTSFSAELLPPEALTQSAISRFILSSLITCISCAHAFLYKTRSRVENVVFYIGYLYTNVFYKFDPLMKIIFFIHHIIKFLRTVMVHAFKIKGWWIFVHFFEVLLNSEWNITMNLLWWNYWLRFFANIIKNGWTTQ